mmetsp:Transcript_111934/g.176299  ORF Transcript_111934/g.176299 Transcript_111934/m.176299 type:complete len:89 (-) Transcript_111934:19-285(-)
MMGCMQNTRFTLSSVIKRTPTTNTTDDANIEKELMPKSTNDPRSNAIRAEYFGSWFIIAFSYQSPDNDQIQLSSHGKWFFLCMFKAET